VSYLSQEQNFKSWIIRKADFTKTNGTTMINSITTEEFPLACWMHSNTVRLTGHIRENNKSTFTFEGENVDDLLNEYYQGSAMTNVAEYTASIRQLKALMYNGTTIQPNNYHDQYKKGSL
jgi:hypothetical protein